MLFEKEDLEPFIQNQIIFERFLSLRTTVPCEEDMFSFLVNLTAFSQQLSGKLTILPAYLLLLLTIY